MRAFNPGTFVRRTLTPLLGLLVGCDFITTDKDTSAHSGDTRDGTGNPTTTDTTEPPTTLDDECDELFETPDPGANGLGACVTDEIACGQTVRGTIRGGSTVFANEPDLAWEQCSGQGPFGDDLGGPERVYRVDTAGYDYVSVRLVSCERTQLLWYQTAQVCPEETLICSYITVDGSTDQSDDIVLSGSGVMWFVVEGLAGADGNFELTVECGNQ